MCFRENLHSATRPRTAAVLLFALVSMSTAHADHPSLTVGDAGSGPISISDSAPLPQGMSSLSLRYEHIDLDRRSDSELLAFGAAEIHAHSVDSTRIVRLSFAHGVTPDLTLGIQLPWVSRENVRAGEDDGGPIVVEEDGTPEGIGDLQLFGLYRVLRDSEAGVELSVIGGLTLPTGTTDEENDEGVEIGVDHQPGDGSVDVTLGVATSHTAGPFTFHASALGTLTSEGDRDTEVGDRLDWGLGVATPVAHGLGGTDLSLDLVLELYGEVVGKVEEDGVKDDHTGGNFIFIAPGFRVGLDSVWSAFGTVGFPLHDDPNGEGHETDLRLEFGVSATF